MKKLIKYVIMEVLRTRIVVAYTVILLLISFSIFGLEDNQAKGMLSMMNVELILVPLVCVMFSSIYLYNSGEFTELIVGQPLPRKSIWRSMYFGVTSSLLLAFVVGAGIPMLFFGSDSSKWIMLLMGMVLVIVFSGMGLALAIKIRDKAKGVGMAIFSWLFFSILFDALVLFASFQLSDYPIEKGLVGAIALNPIDLARVLIIMKMDIGAMLGYTGAVFTNYFGSQYGTIISIVLMAAWCYLPYKLGMRWFVRKDF
jgi:Cu-processing system permease protein